MTPPNGTKYRAIVDTHRHPVGAKLRDRMAEAGLFDPSQADRDLVFWKTSNRIFRLGPAGTDPVASALVTARP